MNKVEVPITDGFYESYSLPISAQRCQNMFIHETGYGRALLSVAGAKLQTTSGAAQEEANRGMHNKGGLAYCVNGDKLYLIKQIPGHQSASYRLVELGVISGTGPVSMSDNGTQLLIINSEGNGWIYNESSKTPFQQITDTDFKANGNPVGSVFIDGYFAIWTDSKKFIISSLNDGLSYNALDFASAEADPDGISSMQVVNNQLVVIGEETTEVFTNRGGSGFPFQRINGLVINIGTRSPNSVTKIGQTFFMLGSSGTGSDTAYLFNGNGYEEVANAGIARLIEVSDTTKASSTSYGYLGSEFAACSFGKTTIVYDTKTRAWHERVTISPANGETSSVVNNAVEAYGQTLVGSSFSGAIGTLDMNEYRDFGVQMQRSVSTARLKNNLIRRASPLIEMFAETGEVLGNDPEPVISLSISRDGGKTFGQPRFRGLGKTGQFDRRVCWRRNGVLDKGIVLKFDVDANSKISLISLFLGTV